MFTDKFPFSIAGSGVYPYNIEYSALFGGTSDYLSWTPSVANASTKWAFSAFVKPCLKGSGYLTLFSAGPSQTTNIYLDGTANGSIRIEEWDGSSREWRGWSDGGVFVDQTAWHHVLVIFDSTLTDESDRLQLWLNGRRISFGAYYVAPALNTTTDVGRAVQHTIATRSGAITPYYHCDGYIADAILVMDESVSITDFGEFSSQIDGLWIPKKYEGVCGTNGFHLDFADAANLGKDVSGNGNDWTVNGSPVQTLDTPTNNYSVLNALDPATDDGVLKEGSTFLDTSGGDYGMARNTMAVNADKYYIEFEQVHSDGMVIQLGTHACGNGSAPDAVNESVSVLLNTNQVNNGRDWDIFNFEGDSQLFGSGDGSTSGVVGEVWAFAIDGPNKTVQVYREGVPVGNPTTWVTEGPMYIAPCDIWNASTRIAKVNFGRSGFKHAAPSGYKSLCSQALPEVFDPSKGAAIRLREGTGADTVVSGLNFSPDFVLIKRRDAGSWGNLFDTVRGPNRVIFTNESDTERDDLDRLTAFNLDGYSIGSSAGVNASGGSFLDFCLKRGPEFGLDIVEYTGDGVAGRVVPHNCGGIPEMIIVKKLDAAATDWMVYHRDLGATHWLKFNSTDASQPATAFWNDTEPTSVGFTLGSAPAVNENGSRHIAYVFRSVPGFSKVFSYEGNGSEDGAYVDLGFTPHVALFKNSTVSGNAWCLLNTTTSPRNYINKLLTTSDSVAEYTAAADPSYITGTSGGFKVSHTGVDLNGSAHRIVGIAWAAQPQKYSNAF